MSAKIINYHEIAKKKCLKFSEKQEKSFVFADFSKRYKLLSAHVKVFWENIYHLSPKYSFLIGYKGLNVVTDDFYFTLSITLLPLSITLLLSYTLFCLSFLAIFAFKNELFQGEMLRNVYVNAIFRGNIVFFPRRPRIHGQGGCLSWMRR